MVEHLIEEAVEEYKFQPKQTYHNKYDKLDKFYYMKAREAAEDFEENKEYLYRSGDLKNKDAKALENGPSADGKPEIKIENPEYISMKNRLKVLVSGKTRLAGVLDKCKDVLSQFDAKKDNKPDEYQAESKDIHKEFATKVNGALEILEELRILVLLVCMFILKKCSC